MTHQYPIVVQTIDPSGIAARTMRRTVEILLNLVEELNSRNQRARVRKSEITG